MVYEQDGYWCVDVVSFGGIQVFKFNHRLVAEAFARSHMAAKLELEQDIMRPRLNTDDVFAEVDMILKGGA